MAQFARPSSDIVTSPWTTTPLWSDIDDGASPDGTVILSDSSPDSTEPFAVELSDVTDPSSSTGHIIRCHWAKNSNGGGAHRGQAELRQGYVSEGSQGTLIATLTGAAIDTTTLTTQTYTLSAAEADNITDYSDLQLRVWAEKSNGTTGNRVWKIDYVELEVPDAGSTTYDETGRQLVVTSTLDGPTQAQTMDEAPSDLATIVSTIDGTVGLLLAEAVDLATIVSTLDGSDGRFWTEALNLATIVSTLDETDTATYLNAEDLATIISTLDATDGFFWLEAVDLATVVTTLDGTDFYVYNESGRDFVITTTLDHNLAWIGSEPVDLATIISTLDETDTAVFINAEDLATILSTLDESDAAIFAESPLDYLIVSILDGSDDIPLPPAVGGPAVGRGLEERILISEDDPDAPRHRYDKRPRVRSS